MRGTASASLPGNSYVQHDAANVFDRLHNGKVARAIEVGCWFHARRRFFKLIDKEPDAAKAIQVIQRLYRIEKSAAKQGLDPDAVRALRQREAVPLLATFRRWLVRKKKRHSPASAMGQAIAYATNHWKALTRYTEDGRLKPDNNICEGQIRDVALGRKNFLFAGSHEAADRIALYYSLMRSCALNGVNPYTYIRDVIIKLAAGWPAARLDELLPDRWTPEQPEEQPQSDPA